MSKRKIIVTKGGPGSGNFGHVGRPGKVGGSALGKGKRKYIRLRFKSINGNKVIWAVKMFHRGSFIYYRKIDKLGDMTNELIVLSPKDIIYEKPAKMNTHYGELELEE